METQTPHRVRDLTRHVTLPPSPAAINSLAQDEALLSLFQRQDRVEEKLVKAQARLAQQDARVATAGLTSDTTSLAQMAASSAPRN